MSNGGTVPVNFSGIAATGPDAAMFAQTSTCASVLNAGQSCTVSVTFTPTSAGAKAATLSLSSNAATNPVVALSGTGASRPANWIY